MKNEEMKKIVKRTLVSAASDAADTYDGRPSKKWGVLFSPEPKIFEMAAEPWGKSYVWSNPYQIFIPFAEKKSDILSIWEFFSKEDIFAAATNDEKKSLERLDWRSEDVSVMACFDELDRVTRSELIERYALYDPDDFVQLLEEIDE